MRLYFAGGEAWGDLLMSMGVKYQLLSFFYLRQMLRSGRGRFHTLLARMRRAQSKGYSFALDSGAFSYQERQGKREVPEPAAYFAEYKHFIEDYGDVFDLIAEFDVDGSAVDADGAYITTGEVDYWTDELFDLGPDVARRVMPCYHDHRGETWLRAWLLDTRSPLIAFASSSTRPPATFITECHRFGKWVHGFAQTRIKTEARYALFDSVDSTTWLRGDKFGDTCIFQEGKFIVLGSKRKVDRVRYRAYFEGWGLDWAKIAQDDLQELRLSAIIAWRELANYWERQEVIRSGGKTPYLYELAQRGVTPGEHPLVTQQRKNNGTR